MNDNKDLIQFCFKKIEKRIGGMRCPLCHNADKNKFVISEQFYQIPSMVEKDAPTEEDGKAVVGLHLPLTIARVVPVTCKHCGHMMFFHFDAVEDSEGESIDDCMELW